MYQARRDLLVASLEEIGWPVPLPKATIYAWAPIPEPFRKMGSLDFSKWLLAETGVVVAPGVGFGPHGEGKVRIALVQGDERIKEAVARMGERMRLR